VRPARLVKRARRLAHEHRREVCQGRCRQRWFGGATRHGTRLRQSAGSRCQRLRIRIGGQRPLDDGPGGDRLCSWLTTDFMLPEAGGSTRPSSRYSQFRNKNPGARPGSLCCEQRTFSALCVVGSGRDPRGRGRAARACRVLGHAGVHLIQRETGCRGHRPCPRFVRRRKLQPLCRVL
jgi:hypothetical protein